MVQVSFQFIHERTRQKGHKQKHKRFCLTVRQNLLTMSMTKHWYCLIREPGGSLEIFKSCLDSVLDKKALSDTLRAETLGRIPEVISNIFQPVIHAKVWRKSFRPDEFRVSSKPVDNLSNRPQQVSNKSQVSLQGSILQSSIPKILPLAITK